jgi:hypothetical protein
MGYEYRKCSAGTTREGRLKFLNEAAAEGLEYVQGFILGDYYGSMPQEVLFRRVEVMPAEGPAATVVLDGRVVGSIPLPIQRRDGCTVSRVSVHVHAFGLIPVDTATECGECAQFDFDDDYGVRMVPPPTNELYWKDRVERAEAELLLANLPKDKVERRGSSEGHPACSCNAHGHPGTDHTGSCALVVWMQGQPR